MTDNEIMLEVRGTYQHLSRIEAVKAVAAATGQTVKGVSGRVTRAENTISGRAALMAWTQENAAHTDRASEEINILVGKGKLFFEHRRKLLQTSGTNYAVFISDTHYPYHDVRALELAYNIIADLPGVAYISGLSDGFDLSTLSRWPDGRNARDRAIDSDLRGVLEMYSYHLDTLKQIAPDAMVLALVGNHDVRLVSGNSGIENYMQYQVMNTLAGHGLTFLSDFSRENIIQINKYLYWFHGRHARKNRVMGAAVNYDYVKYAQKLREDFTLVFGHAHDPIHYQNMHANSYGSGCLCQLQPHYNRHSQHWKQGIVISKFAEDWNLTYNITFAMVGDKLTAYNPFNGRDYEV